MGKSTPQIQTRWRVCPHRSTAGCCPMGMNLNQELVKQGWCWWDRKYAPGDTVLEGLEKEAREARKGLGNDPQPVPPWVWRKRSR